MQMDSMNLAATVAATFWLSVSESARAELLRLLDARRFGNRSVRVNWAMVAVLVSFVLLVTMEPEARVFGCSLTRSEWISFS